MNSLDQKINQWFPGLVVRKDLVKTVKGNAIVPTYVLEYLLGQYCATSDDATIRTGIETVKEILRKHYVHRNEAGLVRSTIREKGRHKVIDKISVALNDRADVYEAEFANLGIKKVLVDPGTGLMKILFPHGAASKEEVEDLLKYTVEGRKRVKDQLMRIDSTYAAVRFSYLDKEGQAKPVTTLEEEEYPHYYYKTVAEEEDTEV